MPLGKITVLTGANNSGKSSVLYGLMVLQDFVYNPNQSLENLFALPFINLGGFEETVCNMDNVSMQNPNYIKLGVTYSTYKVETSEMQYHLSIGKDRTTVNMKSEEGPFKFNANLHIGLPYTGNIFREFKAQNEETEDFANFKWNGLQATIDRSTSQLSNLFENDLSVALNSPIGKIFSIDFIPISRGFTKPHYNLVPINGTINSEEEIATMLKTGKYLINDNKINYYLEQISQRIIDTPKGAAPGLFSIIAKNTNTGRQNYLVNEGSGTNQLVTLLTKIFQFNKELICIDEPEIHLHPSMIRKLAGAFVAASTDSQEMKQFLVSTHSEHFVQALLTNVAQRKIKPEDVKIYHLTMTENGTKIEAQKVNEKGQVEGGLSHFYEAELSDLKSMFKLVD